MQPHRGAARTRTRQDGFLLLNMWQQRRPNTHLRTLTHRFAPLNLLDEEVAAAVEQRAAAEL